MKISKLSSFPYEIILGSASPRRQQLLGEMGFKFKAQPVNANEGNWPAGLQGWEIARYFAEKKSEAFPRPLGEKELLITSDTVVWLRGKMYSKPSGLEEGRQMLSELSGNAHEVFTAVCLRSADKRRVFHGGTTVYFKALGEDEIDYYLQNFKPWDKAGSYGVQEWLGYVGIEKIEGSFYTVMGLPVKELYEELLSF